MLGETSWPQEGQKGASFGMLGALWHPFGAALDPILENVDFEGGPQIVIFDAKST